MTLFESPPPSSGPLAVTLRPYQQEAIDGIYRWFGEATGNPLVVVPTGGGKSLIIAGFIHSVLTQWPKERILVVTHVRELIAQNHAALLRAWPGAAPFAGIYSAGLRRREHDAPVLFAGIQSVYDKAKLLQWVDLVIVDEAHLIPREGMGRYQKLLADLRSVNSQIKVIGLTATPFRTGEGSLDKGDDRMFHGIAYDCKLVPLIRDGYLAPVTSKATDAKIETSGIRTQAGDFVASDLEQAALADGLVARAMAEVVARGQGRKSWLLFCCGIDHADACAQALQGLHGIRCETVFGDTPADERDRILSEFRAGTLQAVANYGVLTTGFDAPNVDLIALLRPTKSPGLYVQMVGRGLRTAPGKTNCLVLDFGGNVERHGPIDTVNMREPRKGQGGEEQVMARKCPKCESLVAIAATVCPDCGYEWPVEEASHAETPDEQAIIAGLEPVNPIERWDVTEVYYTRHEKTGKPATLMCEYSGGLNRRVREWVCFDHPDGSFPKRKASSWWRDRGGAAPPPGNVEEARCRIEAGELLEVLGVVVDTRGDWFELRGVKLGSEAGLGDRAEHHDAPSPPPDYSDIPF